MRLETKLPYPSMALSDDGETLVVHSGESGCLWHNGKEAGAVKMARHPGPFDLTTDGSRLIGGDITLSVFDVQTRKRLLRLRTRDGADPMVFSSDGCTVAFREISGGSLRLVDVNAGTDVATTKISAVREGYFGAVRAAGMSRSGAVLGTVVQRRREWDLVRWDLPTLRPISVDTYDYVYVSGRGGNAVALRDGHHELIDLDNPTRVFVFEGVEGIMEAVKQIRIDSSGRYVAFLDGLHIDPWLPMRIWDAVENREVAVLDDESKGQAMLLGPGAAFAIVHDRKKGLVHRVAV